MFIRFLYLLRAEGLPVGMGEWIAFLDGLARGLAVDVDGLYRFGRAVLCRTETDYDAYDLAFAHAFKDAALDPATRAKLEEWLADAIARTEGELVKHGFKDEDELWQEFLKRLQEQKERHDGGNKWIGTGGTSPFGHSGRASEGVRVGGAGGNRGAIQVATDRKWENYRTDHVLDSRDMTVALKALRRLHREGSFELDLDATIDRTCENAGDIELVERRQRENQVRVVLLMDSGGSMSPHAQRVEQLFRAAEEVGTFKSFETWYFHNCIYGWLWKDFETGERKLTGEVLADLTPRHRLIFVGDASMAPYELFSMTGWAGGDSDRSSGIEWLRRFKSRCTSSVWLNPDPQKWWDHPTVSAIGQIFPMFELNVDGLRDGVAKLRAAV